VLRGLIASVTPSAGSPGRGHGAPRDGDAPQVVEAPGWRAPLTSIHVQAPLPLWQQAAFGVTVIGATAAAASTSSRQRRASRVMSASAVATGTAGGEIHGSPGLRSVAGPRSPALRGHVAGSPPRVAALPTPASRSASSHHSSPHVPLLSLADSTAGRASGNDGGAAVVDGAFGLVAGEGSDRDGGADGVGDGGGGGGGNDGDSQDGHSTMSDTSGASGSDLEAPYEFVSPHTANPALSMAGTLRWGGAGLTHGGGGGDAGDSSSGDGWTPPPTTALRAMRSSDLRHMLLQYREAVRSSAGGAPLDLSAPGDWAAVSRAAADGDEGESWYAGPTTSWLTIAPSPPAPLPPSSGLGLGLGLGVMTSTTSAGSSLSTFRGVSSGSTGGGGAPTAADGDGFQWPSFEFLASPAASGIVTGSARRDSDYSTGAESEHTGGSAASPGPRHGGGGAGSAASPTKAASALGVPGFRPTAATPPTGMAALHPSYSFAVPSGSSSSKAAAPPTARPAGPGFLLGPAVGAKRTAITADYDMGVGAGQGGYAAVKFATKKGAPPLPCVVKCIRKRYLLSPEERDSVTREVEIHRSLSGNHPHIVTLMDVYEDEQDYVYLVLERVSGGDLATFIRRKAVRQFSETQVGGHPSR